MTSRDFCFWLQGFFEISGATGGGAALGNEEVDLIRRHLDLVFKHEIDPSMGPKPHQAALSAIHAPGGTLLRC